LRRLTHKPGWLIKISKMYYNRIRMKINYISWTKGSIEHIAKHKVTPEEVEEVLFEDEPYVFRARGGNRYAVYGTTDGGRYLIIVLQISKSYAKVITARDMTLTERRKYQEIKG